jgi:hypothetical protein
LTQQNRRHQWARHFRNTRGLAGRWHARQLSATSTEIQAANGDRLALYAYRNNPDISQPPALPGCPFRSRGLNFVALAPKRV